MSKHHIFGPYFFEEDESTVTVTAKRYISMLQNEFLPELRRKRYSLRRIFFQHDNATPHTAKATIEFLHSKFNPDHVISNGLWPPRSPDLSPLDSFMFGYLKSKVYRNAPLTLLDLRQNIIDEVDAIDSDMLARVMDTMDSRVGLCMRVQGGHFQQLL